MFAHLQSLLKHKTECLLDGCILCCFLKNEIPLLRDPNEWRCDNKHDTNGWRWICLLLMFLIRAFYCVQMNPLCKLYIEPYRKNCQAHTDALNKNVVQYRGKCEWNASQISISTNVVSTKMVSFRNKCNFFATETGIYLKGVLITFHLVLFWGWGVGLDFL